MSEKVILILVDGMRPDGMEACGHPFVERLKSVSTYSLSAKTVFPSVTLPCHMSLFHSVDPDRHGILTNTYVPMVRPVVGLVDQLAKYDKQCAFFYTWEALRDLTRPHSLRYSQYISLKTYHHTDERITDEAVRYIDTDKPDFAFLYLGDTDETGHDFGWMGKEYLCTVNKAMEQVERVYNKFKDEYTIILLADHGGHDRIHGTEMEEDMMIPVMFWGKKFEKGCVIDNISIKDIAVTVVQLMEVPKVKEWEGKSVL